MSDVVNEVPRAHYNRSAEIAKLAAALCKAQAAMGGAKKDSENPHFKSAYADLASIWEAIRKPLTDNGLSVVQFPRAAGNGVEIETTLLHTSGEFMRDVLWVPCGKNDAQGIGSAITYGRRYALAAVCGIAPVDDDGNAAVAGTKPGAKGMAGGGTDFRPPRRNNAAMQAYAEEARKDGLTDETRSAYEVDKLKKAIDNQWIVTNTTSKGKDDQLFDYLDMAREPDDIVQVLTNNAVTIDASPNKIKIEAAAEKLLQWFEARDASGKTAA